MLPALVAAPLVADLETEEEVAVLSATLCVFTVCLSAGPGFAVFLTRVVAASPLAFWCVEDRAGVNEQELLALVDVPAPSELLCVEGRVDASICKP
jgi:ABC-type sulfate transport system permease component